MHLHWPRPHPRPRAGPSARGAAAAGGEPPALTGSGGCTPAASQSSLSRTRLRLSLSPRSVNSPWQPVRTKPCCLGKGHCCVSGHVATGQQGALFTGNTQDPQAVFPGPQCHGSASYPSACSNGVPYGPAQVLAAPLAILANVLGKHQEGGPSAYAPAPTWEPWNKLLALI